MTTLDMVRLFSKKDLKSVNASPDSIILGATFAEAKSSPARLLELANSHGHERVIGILDQNMDTYADGCVYGSDLCKELRAGGFRGVLCIRTANNPQYHDALYEAGASLVVGKSSNEWPFSKINQAIAALL
jgi:hypothetical protein